QHQAAPFAGPIGDFGFDPDLEAAQGGGEALGPPDFAVEPGGVPDPEEAEVGVQLPLWLQEEGMGALPVRQRVDVLREQALEELEGVGPVDQDGAAGAAVDEGGAGREGPLLGNGVAVVGDHLDTEIIDDVHHASVGCGRARRFRAAATDARMARALLWHSRSSAAGSESATIPAPADTEAPPAPSTTIVRMAMAVS